MNQTSSAPTGKAWKGLLASLILTGAGQFFSGARVRGIIWFVTIYAGYLSSLIVYNWSFIPAKSGLLLLCVWLLVWLGMLYDSYRPIRPLRWWTWIALVIASLLLSETPSLIAHQLFHAYKMPTQSMIPTILSGDQLMVCRTAYRFREPQRGDLIVFRTKEIPQIRQYESEKEIMYLKRLVGLPGDHIDIADGHIWINGSETKFGDPAKPIEYTRRSPAIVQSLEPLGTESYVVPSDKYFVLGDNCRNSFDSRYWGGISRDAIYGKVTKIYWPWNRISAPR